MVEKRSIPSASSASHAAFFAQAGLPFVIQHDFDRRLLWDAAAADGASALRACLPANNASWHALLTPDGVVGAYPRDCWSVSLASEQPACGESDSTSKQKLMDWVPLKGQSSTWIESSSRPRHIVTQDFDLEQALAYWEASIKVPEWVAGDSSPEVYLHGRLDESASLEMLAGTVFEELQGTSCFGRTHFNVSMYASREGTQTNLHADQHSGFLVQVVGSKRVVLISAKHATALRCPNWGKQEAPVNRRSWYDNGVPNASDWDSQPPFVGLDAQEIEIGPGQALYIPKRFFHDVLSKSPETLGLVLRCND